MASPGRFYSSGLLGLWLYVGVWDRLSHQGSFQITACPSFTLAHFFLLCFVSIIVLENVFTLQILCSL